MDTVPAEKIYRGRGFVAALYQSGGSASGCPATMV
jgi:hypothetical protein